MRTRLAISQLLDSMDRREVQDVAEVDSRVMAKQVGPQERKPEHSRALKSA